MKILPTSALRDITVHSVLADGTAVCLRTITSDDEPMLRAGIAAMSAESRRFRFFSAFPEVPEAVTRRLVAVDGHAHMAWGAICTECDGTPAIGAVHAVRDGPDGPVGEFSVAVVDAFQGLGLARMMTAALLIECRAEGMKLLDVHIMSENAAARRLIKTLGATQQDESTGVVDYRLDVADGIAALRADGNARGVQDVFSQLEGGRGN